MILDQLQDTQPAHVFTFEGKIFNKPKNTCIQLYVETAGLEMAFNTIILSSELAMPSELLHRFHKTVTDTEFAHVCRVTINRSVASKLMPFEGLNELATWCNHHPSIAVNYILPHFAFLPLNQMLSLCPTEHLKLSAEALLFTGCYNETALWGCTWPPAIAKDNLAVARIFQRNKICVSTTYLFRWCFDNQREVLQAANLHPWPADLGPRKEWGSALMELAGEANEEMGWEWCDIVEKWVQKGI
jgi:hypothetical protein